MFGFMHKIGELIGSARGTNGSQTAKAEEPNSAQAKSRSSMNGNPFVYKPGVPSASKVIPTNGIFAALSPHSNQGRVGRGRVCSLQEDTKHLDRLVSMMADSGQEAAEQQD